MTFNIGWEALAFLLFLRVYSVDPLYASSPNVIDVLLRRVL